MRKEYKVTLIESDFNGDIFDTQDCIGYRSFKRAVGSGEEVEWTICVGSMQERSGIFYFYESFNSEGKIVSMMRDVKVGDEITFKKRQ